MTGSWYRKKGLSLFNKAASLIVLAGMASFADAYWIEPNWIKTEQVVIHDTFTPTLALPRRGGGITVMRGLFDRGKTKMYVNRGIGTTHIPIRFFNRPEITLLAIRN